MKPRSERAVRAARLAPLASHEELASAAGITVRGLRNALVALPTRGLCGEVARRMSLSGHKLTVRVFAASSVWCPPGVIRALPPSSADDFQDAANTANPAAWTTRGHCSHGARWDSAPSTLRRHAFDSYSRLSASGALACPACPPAVLVGVAEGLCEQFDDVPFADDPEPDRPLWPPAAVAVFAASPRRRARLAAAGLESCPSVALAAFAGDDERDLRVAAISNQACPPEPLAAAAACDDFGLNAAACKHPNLAPDVQARLAWSADPRTRALIATNISCGAHTLRRLANDESVAVRASAAANPALDAETLQQLTRDPAAKVRAGALTHPSCPPEALTAAASTYHRTARLLALDHPNFPPEALTAAATHTNPKVRYRALSRPDCPPEAITAAIVAHRDEPTAQIAVSHPQCPPGAMRVIAEAALAAGGDYGPEFGSDGHLDHLHPQAHPPHTGRSGRALPAAAAALDLLDGPAELFTRRGPLRQLLAAHRRAHQPSMPAGGAHSRRAIIPTRHIRARQPVVSVRDAHSSARHLHPVT